MLASGYVLDPSTRKATTKLRTMEVYLGILLTVLVFPRRTAPTTPNQKNPSQYAEWFRKSRGAIAMPAMALAKRLSGMSPAHRRLFIGMDADTRLRMRLIKNSVHEA